jgi:hypothetical protein
VNNEIFRCAKPVHRVDWDHEENTTDVKLMARVGVVLEVAVDQMGTEGHCEKSAKSCEVRKW